MGISAPVRDHFKGWKLKLRSKGFSGTWTLDVRAYNDGVAWRYIVPGTGKRKVTDEASSFVLPEGSKYWSHHNTGNYEANFLHFNTDKAAPARQITMPATVTPISSSGGKEISA